MSLYAMIRDNTGRPVHKLMHYVVAYERHFGHLVSRPCTFLEIGAGNGGSSQMWKKWLGPLARIVTIDIKDLCKQFEDEQIAVRIGSQDDPAFLRALVAEFGAFDAVLDDGSHQAAHVLTSLHTLYPIIAQNAVYMIEDTHTAYWPEYGGSQNANNTIVEFAREMIHKLNRDHHRGDQHDWSPDVNDKNTFSMSVYDSIIVLEKAAYSNRINILIGDESKRVNY